MSQRIEFGLRADLDRLRAENVRKDEANLMLTAELGRCVDGLSASQRRVGELEDALRTIYHTQLPPGGFSPWVAQMKGEALRALSPEESPSLGEPKSLETQQKD